LALTFLPALLLPVLGDLGFANSTFGDVDFALIGILLGQAGNIFTTAGIYAIVFLLVLILIIPNFIKTKTVTINHIDEDTNM